MATYACHMVSFFQHLHWYNQQTVYRLLSNARIPWKIYYHDIPQSLVLTDLWHSEFAKNFEPIEKFFEAAQGDPSKFPSYCFIEPRYEYTFLGEVLDLLKSPRRFFKVFADGNKLPNDDHPPHDVLQGEALIAEIFNALLGTLWDSSLLIIIFDEHGGFYDRKLPLQSAMPPCGAAEALKYKYPCGTKQELSFAFDKLGVRVPAILVSPWVKKNDVCSTIFDHTSILKYVCATPLWTIRV